MGKPGTPTLVLALGPDVARLLRHPVGRGGLARRHYGRVVCALHGLGLPMATAGSGRGLRWQSCAVGHERARPARLHARRRTHRAWRSRGAS
jgi:hypothetical protein